LCEKGELFDFVFNLQLNLEMDGLPETTCRFLFDQIISGVEYLHDRGIAHRDLKCENIFLDQYASTRIADFGLSKIFAGEGASELKTRVGTINHMAPELSARKAYVGTPVDVFACGVILFVMLTCQPPFEEYNDVHYKRLMRNPKMANKCRKIEMDENALDLVVQCL
jgi:serine/threonine protein kinase